MKRIRGKISAVLLFFAMCFLIVQTDLVNAAEEIKVQCGDNVYATLDELGVLTISGNGDMWDRESTSHDGPFTDFNWKIYKVVIEDGVTSIGDYAFGSGGAGGAYKNVTKVEISNTVKTIGKGAFAQCSGLYEITIPGSVEIIDKSAFSNTSLSSCTLNKGLKKIGEYAFGFAELESITIPEGVEVIGSNAFGLDHPSGDANYDYGVKEAVIYATDVIIAPDAFHAERCTLSVDHDSTAELYAKNNKMHYKYNVYTTKLTFDPNGGKVSKKSKKIVSDESYGTLPIPTRKGYTFTGWYTKANGGEKITADIIVTAKKDSTLYAHWKLSKKTKLTFNANGGKVSTKSKTITYNEKYGELPKATRKGYTFTGWYTKKSVGERIKAGTKVTTTKNSTVYAHWKKVTVKKMKKPTVINNKSKTIKVKFEKMSGVAGYEICYSTNVNMKSAKKVKVSGTETSKVIKNLKKDKIYYVQVRAIKKDSLKNKIYGKWSDKTKVIIN